jgi:Flp pilus assembly protein TadD
LAPRDPHALVTLGHVRLLRQRWPEAAEAFVAALKLAPRDAELHYDLGRAYQLAGKVEQAAEAYRQALKCDPKHPPARRALAELTGATTQAGAEPR